MYTARFSTIKKNTKKVRSRQSYLCSSLFNKNPPEWQHLIIVQTLCRHKAPRHSQPASPFKQDRTLLLVWHNNLLGLQTQYKRVWHHLVKVYNSTQHNKWIQKQSETTTLLQTNKTNFDRVLPKLSSQYFQEEELFRGQTLAHWIKKSSIVGISNKSSKIKRSRRWHHPDPSFPNTSNVQKQLIFSSSHNKLTTATKLGTSIRLSSSSL